MKYHNLAQGSAEWLALRAGFLNASEAPVMMGASPKVSRTELLQMKSTGSEREYSDWVQRNLFDKGHAYEASARPIIEDTIGDELFPTTGTKEIDGLPLLASFDGLTMLGDTVFEHKMWNESLAQSVRDNALSDEYKWQLDQQLLISSAEKAIFVVSDGTPENMVYMEYLPDQERFNRLIAGWKQFAEDLANYTPVEQKVEAIGRTPDNLPALLIEMSGAVTSSNLTEFKAHALEALSDINRDLVTDQDFADAEKTVKWCKEVEDKIAATKSHALSQTATIEEAFRLMDDVSEEVRRIRLELDKLVKAEKENRRLQIRQAAIDDFTKHIKTVNACLEVVALPDIACDVTGAMKGKRTIASLEDAASTAVANAKVEANQWAEKIEANLTLITELGKDHLYLFSDQQRLVMMETKDLSELISARVVAHEADAKAKAEVAAEKERERIRQEEQAKAQAASKPVEPAKQPPAMPTQQSQEPAPWNQPKQTAQLISISVDEYERLQADSRMLQALIKAGIESWSGYEQFAGFGIAATTE